MFVSLFISPTDLDVTPQPIFTRNIANDVDPRIDVPFVVKIETFLTPDPRPRKPPKFGYFLDARFQLNISGPLILHRSSVKVS